MKIEARFHKAAARHRRAPTAETWFALGTLLAETPQEAARALCKAEGLGKVDPITCWKRCVKLAPKHAQAWYWLAVATMPEPGEDDLARVRRAERYLKRAIEADPRGKRLKWEPYAWLAEAAERRRHDPDALAWYSEANRRGDRYAAARKQVIEGHGARRRGGPAPAKLSAGDRTRDRPERRTRARRTG